MAYTMLVSGAGDGTVRRWDPESCGSVGEPLAGHPAEVYTVAAVPMSDGQTLVASGGEGGIVQVWDPAGGVRVGRAINTRHRTATRRPGAVSNLLAFSAPSNGTMLATNACDPVVRFWDPATGLPVRQHLHHLTLQHDADVDCLGTAPLPDGRSVFAVVTDDAIMRIWDLATDVRRPTSALVATGHTAGVNAMVAVPLPGGLIGLATASGDATVRLWNPATGQQIGNMPINAADPIYAMTVVPLSAGRFLLATAGEGAVVRLWEPATGELVGTPMPIGHIGSVLCIAAIPRQDGRVLLATGGADATIRLWDLMSNSPFGTPMIGHTDEVYAIAAVSVPHVR
ncbi:MAG TPA: hypothetical protein VFR11_21525 [Micromonosporaceae bacterium]|nr:hypothetical protein [Micromonosporaceae bacterium]